MRSDDFDRILSREEGIVPSSGFLSSVMDSVRREAEAPPPIPFPWKRALPGLAAAVLVLGLVFVAGGALFMRGTEGGPLPVALASAITSILQAAKAVRAGWIVLAVLVSFASIKLSARLAESRKRYLLS